MNPTIYKQLDSRWASLPYPTKSSSFGGNGCGCCACVHIAIEQESKKDWTPATLRPWMVNQGFAYPNQGTTWQGITETLKYLGHKDVTCVWSAPMSEAWKELDKGNRIGVLLVSNGRTPDGTYWTSSGHYVAFTDYKVENGQHWFFIKDSGGRNHDGWFCYEKSIKGALPKVWIVERLSAPAPTPKPKRGNYNGEYPNPKKYLEKGDKGTEVTKWQKYLNWSFGGQEGFTPMAEDGIYGNDTYTWTCLFQEEAVGVGTGDGKVGQKTIAKAKEYGGYVEPKKPYDGDYPNPKRYLEKGDKGTEAKKWQHFLNWYGNYGLAEDSIFGQSTHIASCDFQNREMGAGQGDGKVGAKTIARAKEVGGYAPSFLDKWFNALKTQYNWSKNQEYEWVSGGPTVENSKKKGTCISLHSVALQRLGLLPKKGYFYFNPKTKKIAGKSADYVKSHPEIFYLFYPNKTVKQLWKEGLLKIGDYVGYGGDDYHSMVFKGFNADGEPIFDTMGHRRGLNITYPHYAKKKVGMVVRLLKA